MGNIKTYSILNQVVNDREPITWGEYPIFEWSIPQHQLQRQGLRLGPEDYQAPFPGYGYVLNDEVRGIRLSDEMT